MEKELTETEKQQAIEDFEAKQNRRYKRGKALVFVIAGINIIFAISSVILNFNLIKLGIQIALSIALCCGITWVKNLFAIRSAIDAFSSLFLLLGGVMDISSSNSKYVGYFVVVYLVLALCYSIASTVLLFTSKDISEFLYSQKNG